MGLFLGETPEACAEGPGRAAVAALAQQPAQTGRDSGGHWTVTSVISLVSACIDLDFKGGGFLEPCPGLGRQVLT